MKLYPILFEQQLKLLSPEQMKAPKSAFNHLAATKTNYNAPTFALATWKSGYEQAFGLFHVEKYKKHVASGFAEPVESWLCAYAGTTEQHSADCSGAVEINYIARSPEWQGAGSVMYALVSKHFNAPITSDRKSSTSDSAKKAWAKIEADSNWKKVDLDNWKKNDDDAKDWFQFKGSWPNRTIYGSDKPATPNEADDCRLPPTSLHSINGVLGTADAWLYQGPLDSKQLLDHGKTVFSEIRRKYDGMSRDDLIEDISDKADQLFRKYYTGVTG
jgi:hypothetical protein